MSWLAPTNDGGSALMSYVVTPYLAGVAQSPRAFNSTATTETVTGLTNTKSYTFKVAAQNAAGTGPQSLATSAILVGLPTAPTNVIAIGNMKRAAVHWVVPVSNGGSAITGYVVTPYRAGVAQPPLTFASVATSESITGLTNGVRYTFKVTARNAKGTGLQSLADAPIAIGAPTPPSAPAMQSVVPGNAQATLTWTAPTSNGSANVTGYVVTPYVAGVAQPPHTFSAGTKQIETGLTNAQTYTFTVAAVNAAGNSPASAMSGPVTVGAPTAPTVVTATAGVASATVHWLAPVTSNGSVITGYVVSPYVGTVAQTALPFASTALSEIVTGLTTGTTYTFTVAAQNSRGAGPQSLASNGATPT
jgi:Fibronectin type III domain